MDVKLKIKAMVETTQDLPTMPRIWLKIREMTQQSHVSAADIAKEILKDQGMTTRLLKAANSSHYISYRKNITTVSDAIVVLGFSEVRNVVIGYAIHKIAEQTNNNDDFNFNQFWLHSLSTGVAARLIAENVQYASGEEAFVAGLLHDIGKLVIGQLMLKEYQQVQGRIADGLSDLEAENEVLHLDHQVIGRWVAERWYFPELLLHVISQHHRAELEDREKSRYRLVDIIAVADTMAHVIFAENKAELMKIVFENQEKAFYLLGLSKDRWLAIVKDLRDHVRKEVENFGPIEVKMEELREVEM